MKLHRLHRLETFPRLKLHLRRLEDVKNPSQLFWQMKIIAKFRVILQGPVIRPEMLTAMFSFQGILVFAQKLRRAFVARPSAFWILVMCRSAQSIGIPTQFFLESIIKCQIKVEFNNAILRKPSYLATPCVSEPISLAFSTSPKFDADFIHG